ncbi:hypothetical protein V8C34DRAFT_309627 [Trichoderma compactum]
MCNISATASSDSTGGLSYNRENILTVISLSYLEEREELLLIREELEVADDIEFAAITKAKGLGVARTTSLIKTVHFTSRQLIWECNELIASESFPDGLPDFWTYYYVPKRLMADSHKILSAGELVETWGHVLDLSATPMRV